MPSEDDFMDIIKNNDLEKFMAESDSQNLSVKDIHIGIRDMAEALLFLTDFINSFFTAVSEGDEENRPGLSVQTIVYAREMFDYSSKFCDSVMDSITDDDDEYYDDEDDDEDYDEEDDD